MNSAGSYAAIVGMVISRSEIRPDRVNTGPASEIRCYGSGAMGAIEVSSMG